MKQSVTVVGTIFVDCKGFAGQQYRATGRNVGTIRFVHGGVGRNVAENLARLQLDVSFVSTVDQDGIGREVTERLSEAGVNLEYLRHTESGGTGMWLAILDEKGELAGSISQMPDVELLAEWIDEKGEELLARSSHLALELDLNERISRRLLTLAEQMGKPVYGIPGNLEVILAHPDLLQGLECFICNEYEAERLFGGKPLAGAPPQEIAARMQAFLEAAGGPKSMVVTLGPRGSVYYDGPTRTSGYQPVFPVEMTDSSGAGDAFFSGTVMGLIRGLPLSDAVVCGTKTAGWTIESAENTCPDLAERLESDPLWQELVKA